MKAVSMRKGGVGMATSLWAPDTGAGAYLLEGSGNGGVLMLIGILYLMAALMLFIAIGASSGGIGLVALGTAGFVQFAQLVISGISIFLAGLALATGHESICTGFMGVYVGASIGIFLVKFL